TSITTTSTKLESPCPSTTFMSLWRVTSACCAGRIADSRAFLGISRSCYDCVVRDLAVLLLHVVATVARIAGPGGVRAVVAESLLVKQQLLILSRSSKRSPDLRLSDRVVAGHCALLMLP